MGTIAETMIYSIESATKPKMENGVVVSLGPFQLTEFVLNMSAIVVGIAARSIEHHDDLIIKELLYSITEPLSSLRLNLFPQMMGFFENLLKQTDDGWSEDGEEHWNTIKWLVKRWNEYMDESTKR